MLPEPLDDAIRKMTSTGDALSQIADALMTLERELRELPTPTRAEALKIIRSVLDQYPAQGKTF